MRVHRRRYGRSHGSLTGRQAAAVVAAVAVVAAAAHGHGTAAHRTAALAGSRAPDRAAAAAIVFARQQLGKPYLWGGTGPGAFDCSGLVMQAYAAAGVAIPRTSQEQWAAGPRVTVPELGDLVFFAGGDGTVSSPGHVGLVVDPAKHLMIEAYATGYPIRYSQFGTASSPPGDQDPVGFTDPAGSA